MNRDLVFIATLYFLGGFFSQAVISSYLTNEVIIFKLHLRIPEACNHFGTYNLVHIYVKTPNHSNFLNRLPSATCDSTYAFALKTCAVIWVFTLFTPHNIFMKAPNHFWNIIPSISSDSIVACKRAPCHFEGACQRQEVWTGPLPCSSSSLWGCPLINQGQNYDFM